MSTHTTTTRLALVAALLLSACGDDSSTADTTGGGGGEDDISAVIDQLGGPVTIGDVAKGGTYRIANTDFAQSDGFDPTGEYFGSAWTIYNSLMLRTLVSYPFTAGPAGNELVPDLATELPEPSDVDPAPIRHLEQVRVAHERVGVFGDHVERSLRGAGSPLDTRHVTRREHTLEPELEEGNGFVDRPPELHRILAGKVRRVDLQHLRRGQRGTGRRGQAHQHQGRHQPRPLAHRQGR